MKQETLNARNRCNDQERRFAEEYLVDNSVPAASHRAGICTQTGYKWRSDNEVVMAYISALQDDRSETTGMTAERILYEMGLVAFANVVDYTSPDEDDPTMLVVDLSALSREQGAAIKKIKSTTVMGKTTTEIELHDKGAMLKTIGVHAGMISERGKNENRNIADDQDKAKQAIDDLVTKTE